MRRLEGKLQRRRRTSLSDKRCRAGAAHPAKGAWSSSGTTSRRASEGRAWGRSFTELREEGRWISDSSLRIYVDVSTAAKISAGLKAAGLSQALAWALQFLPEYLSEAALAVAYRR